MLRLSASRYLTHSVIVALLTAGAFLAFRAAYFEGIRSSDGANYATVARNVAEGRGLVSSVVQPGLMSVVPSGPNGQAFVIQAPLWPLLLSYAFRIGGATEATLLSLSGALLVAIALEVWWLTLLMTRSTAWAYLAWAFLITNPFVIGTSLAGANVMLQASILGAVFLLAWPALRWWTVLLTGIMLGLACVTRENSIFAAAAVAFMWYRQLDARHDRGERRWFLLGLRSPRPLGVLALAVGVVLLITLVPVRLEASRKAAVIGHGDAPVLRMTFLYYTSVADQGWYFLYDHPMLRVDPKAYFWEHPGELAGKVWYQLRVLFAKETVPALLSFLPWFVPIMAPWLLNGPSARWMTYGLFSVLGVQVLVGSITILNFIYFFAFLPVIVVAVVATARELWTNAQTALRRQSILRATGLAALCAYALAPLPVNATLLVTGVKPGTGDYHLSRRAERDLARFLVEHTETDAVVSSSHAALIAWNTRRTIVMYSGHPGYTIGGSPMWLAIDQQLPIDYIMLNSLALESPNRPLLNGFRQVATLKTPDVEAWLFARPGRNGRAAKGQ